MGVWVKGNISVKKNGYEASKRDLLKIQYSTKDKGFHSSLGFFFYSLQMN
jgi:hypothetical protein